jgi:hypothetical protein
MVNKELLDMAGTGKGIHYILRTKRTNNGRIDKMDRDNLFLIIDAAEGFIPFDTRRGVHQHNWPWHSETADYADTKSHCSANINNRERYILSGARTCS